MESLPTLRRIVTGHNNQGRSFIMSDEALPVHGSDDIGRGVAPIWGASAQPSNNGVAQALPSAIPQQGATSFVVACYPPESHIESLPPELRKIATLSPADQVPGLLKGDTSRHYGMHYSETVDYGVVMSGEVTMVLDDGEVTLYEGDTYVLRGGAHAWVNRGSEKALVAVVVIGAESCADRT